MAKAPTASETNNNPNAGDAGEAAKEGRIMKLMSVNGIRRAGIRFPPGETVPVNIDELTDEQKTKLDDLHLEKIDLADEVHVVVVGGYIGLSTSAEIDYATKAGTPITFHHSVGSPRVAEPHERNWAKDMLLTGWWKNAAAHMKEQSK